jgi:hypothetical protein
LNSFVGGAPPNMLIGPKGSPPVFVNVTATDALLPTATVPKSTDVVLIAMSVSTAATPDDKKIGVDAVRPITRTAAPALRAECSRIGQSVVGRTGEIKRLATTS